MATYLAPAGLGLGDLIVALPVVHSLIAQGEDVRLVARLIQHLAVAQRILGLGGAVLEWQVPSDGNGTDKFIDLRDHPLQRSHWWGSKPFADAYPGWTINDILGTICGDKRIAVDFDNLQPLSWNRDARFAQKVVFIPGSAVAVKSWPLAGWIALKDVLVEAGLDVVVIGEPEKNESVADLVRHGVDWYETTTIGEAIDAVSSALAVVSVDTGLMHVAVQQGIPTVGLFRSNPVYVRKQPHFKALVAQIDCDVRCNEMEVQSAHHSKPVAGPDFCPVNWGCQIGDGVSQCMRTVPSYLVFQALNDLLKTSHKRGRHRRHIPSDSRPKIAPH